jgi:hypothetical protein
MKDLTDQEYNLLAWIDGEGVTEYGTCHGDRLDRLVELGFVQLRGLAQTPEQRFDRTVSVTDAGRSRLGKG